MDIEKRREELYNKYIKFMPNEKLEQLKAWYKESEKKYGKFIFVVKLSELKKFLKGNEFNCEPWTFDYLMKLSKNNKVDPEVRAGFEYSAVQLNDTDTNTTLPLEIVDNDGRSYEFWLKLDSRQDFFVN